MIPRILIAVGLLFAVSHSNAALVITEVMSSSAHTGGTNNGDWFELTNTGLLDFDLTGYSWDDNSVTAGSSFFGGLTTIGAGKSVIFTEETLGAEAAWKSNWGGLSGVTVVNLGSSGFQGLGATATGDSVNIYNNSNVLVASVTFGLATTGFSFEWDTAGGFLGLSAIGENGAFQASSNGQTTGNGPGVDVASPGVAVAPVPEPGTVAMLGSGLCVLLYGFRRRLRL